MDTKVDFISSAERKIVYVRSVEVADLPEDVQEQAEGLTTLYALHDTDGERLALVRNREMAFALAWENDMAPVAVH